MAGQDRTGQDRTRQDRTGHKLRLLITSLLVVVVILVVGGFCGYKFIKHEKNQNQKISDLRSQVSLLQARMDTADVSWLDDGYNYFAIGNSITSHPLSSYWWNEDIGMAATTADKDYVHLISTVLPAPSKFCAYNFSVWEVQSHDRAETIDLLDGYLSDKLDQVTIQLSENASDISTFEEDYVELIEYVKNGAPNAQIIVIDDFWDSGEKSKMKMSAAEKENVDFVSLEDIKGKDEYQAGLGTVVYDKDGNEHVIEHEGVAAHPGDKGMAYIAEVVEKVIEQ